jgi:uncharacterized protein Yka (UPF0111/DUF47 family)
VKTAVLEAIGETALSRAAGLNAALAANDRVKYLLTLVQMAAEHARHPGRPAHSLRAERLAAGIDDAALDEVVGAAGRAEERCRIPGAAALLARIADEVRRMAAPLADDTRAAFAPRLAALLAAVPDGADDLVDPAAITAMTRAGGGADGDSLHRLVMDLHKALNAAQAAFAEERLDGAAVYGLADDDRPLVAAFMAGVNRTAPLKFDHPGLATTATRDGARLVIQNDIGTTDAHVIVITVAGETLTLTYTDLHAERVRFLRTLLAGRGIVWSDERIERAASLAEGGAFTLLTGHLAAANPAEFATALDFIGSRLVFLIDWNRARKQLRSFLRGPDRVALLAWAAENGLGHRGFLELGGARLVNDAVEATAGSAMHFGDRLCDVLGDAAAIGFLRFVLRAASQGLRARQSRGLIADRVRAELQRHFASEGRRLLGLIADHAGLVFETASLLCEGVHAAGAGERNHVAHRARALEHDADQLVIATRDAVRRRTDQAPLFSLIEHADDAADQLEEGAFLVELLGRGAPAGEALEALATLADTLVEAAQEWIRALAAATQIDPARDDGAGAQDDIDDFLAAVDRVSALEHQADDEERALTAAAVRHARDFRELHLYAAAGHCLEEAADALRAACLGTRDHILGKVLGG